MGHCGSLDIRPCGLRHGVSAGGTLCLRLFFAQMDVQVMTWLQNEATTPPPSVNLYPKGGNPGKKVEIPVAAGWKSLPKMRKSAEKVENPVAVIRESLPKVRKSAEKVENPSAAIRESLPKRWKSRKKVEIPRAADRKISTQKAEIPGKR